MGIYMKQTEWSLRLSTVYKIEKIYAYNACDELDYTQFAGCEFSYYLAQQQGAWSKQIDKLTAFDEQNPAFHQFIDCIEKDMVELLFLISTPMYERSGTFSGWNVYGISYRAANPILAGHEVMLLNVIRSSPGFIYWKNIDSVYLGCNNNFARVAGLDSPEEIIGKTDYDLAWGKTEADSFREGDRRVMQGHSLNNFEEPQLQADGNLVTVLANKVPLSDKQGKITGVIGVYANITERKKQELELTNVLEELKRANQVKNNFISNMGHDFRTPLSGIMGLSDALRGYLQDPKYKILASEIHAAAGQLMSLCNEILEAAELGADLEYGSSTVFSWQCLTNDVAEFMMPSAHDKGLKLSFEYKSEYKGKFLGSRVLLHRILTNLISNAIKFTKSGEISVTSYLAKPHVEGSDQSVVLVCEVKDTGIGISIEQQKLVFESFQRGSSSYSSEYKGAGLGLYIVRQFVEKLGGRIHLESRLGEGSVFSFSAPLKKVYSTTDHQLLDTENNSPAAETASAETLNKIKQMRVLLVEDDAISRKVGAMVIAKLGCKLDIVATGTAALQAVEHNYYDLILLDIGLPDYHGEVVADQMQQIFKKQQVQSQVVALTAHISKQLEPELLRQGLFCMILRKPLTYACALSVLEGCLQYLNKEEKMSFQVNSKSSIATNIVDSTASCIGPGRTEASKTIKNTVDAGEDILQLFMQELPAEMQLMRQEYKAQNYRELGRLVHRLHGACCYVEVPKLYAAVRELDGLLANEHQDTEQIVSSFTKLEESVTHLLC